MVGPETAISRILVILDSAFVGGTLVPPTPGSLYILLWSFSNNVIPHTLLNSNICFATLVTSLCLVEALETSL